MMSLIVVGEENARREYVNRHLNSLGVHPFDRLLVKANPTIGIEEVRGIKSWLTTKPANGNNKAVVIANGGQMTTEAQNAMLKVLEEPPDSALIIVCAGSTEALLATIVSRCSIFSILNPGSKSQTREKAISVTLADLNTASPGEKLELAQIVAADREKTRQWVQDVLFCARKDLILNFNNKGEHIRRLRQLMKLEQMLTFNVNLRLTVEHFFLDW
ncbi:hypothetical protein HYS11_00200 [Candidatus Gottesmanbacteria bacterium]|nr:hypothetical protein [Candidatus Gottesmanbacteria bacterium]